jgi:hypothetical protein
MPVGLMLRDPVKSEDPLVLPGEHDCLIMSGVTSDILAAIALRVVASKHLNSQRRRSYMGEK